jgi:hypothetical protein
MAHGASTGCVEGARRSRRVSHLCESFFATLECELLDRQRFRTQVEVRLAIFDFHRRLVQSAPPAFKSRLFVAHRLREARAVTGVSESGEPSTEPGQLQHGFKPRGGNDLAVTT